MSTLLIADDNQQITEVLSLYAKTQGFDVIIAEDGQQALDLYKKKEIDLVLLDVMMPKIDGFEVCRQIRKTSDVPIIMVTARSEDFERIMGLEIGADDYIIKPFSPSEVFARVRAVLRRINKTKNSNGPLLILTHNLMIDLDAYVVKIDGNVVPLTKRECEILWLLASNPDMVFSRPTLLNRLWGYDYFGDARTVDSHIKRLRNKLAQYDHPNWDIKTIWGVGYKFEKDITI